MPEDLQHRLQFGDPSVGWPGDETMFIRKCNGEICKSTRCDGWAVAESRTDGSVKYLMHNSSGYCNPSFLEMLAMRRNQSGSELADEIEVNNQRVDAERAAKSDQAIDETAERLYDVFRRS